MGLHNELGRLQGRLEITEKAESTLREDRYRLLADLQRERDQAQAERDRAAQLQDELNAERSKVFWARLFG